MSAVNYGRRTEFLDYSQYTGAGIDTERVALAYMWQRWKVSVCRLYEHPTVSARIGLSTNIAQTYLRDDRPASFSRTT